MARIWPSLVMAAAVAAAAMLGNAGPSVGTGIDVCNYTASDTKAKKSYFYDLSSLWHEVEMSDELYYRDGYGNIAYVNICGVTTTACNPVQAVCERTALRELVGFGSLHTQRIHAINLTGHSLAKGVTVTYSEGSVCSTGGQRGQSVIHIVCGAGEPGVTEMTTSADGCTLTLKIVAPAGCGVEVPYVKPAGGSGASAGTVILILILVGAVLYVGVGCVVNWKFRGATTPREIFPNTEFWLALPALVKDGVLFIAHGFKKGDYVTV